MTRSRTIALLAALLAIVALANCAPKNAPDMSPEASLALRGRQLVAAVSVGLNQVEPLVAAGVLNAREAIVIVEGLQAVNRTCGDLAGVLAIVDQVKDPAQRMKGLQAAAQLLPRAGDQLQRILERPELNVRPATRARVAQVLQGIADVLNVIAAVMPAPSTPIPGVKVS